MKRIPKLVIFILLLVLIFLAYIFWNNNLEEEVILFIESQESYIRNREMNKYLENISQENPEYIAEKRSWIRDLINSNIEDYKLTPINIKRVGFKKVNVIVLQTYSYLGESYRVTLPLVLTKEAEGWKDNDLKFNEKRTENFIIKYSEGTKLNAKMVMDICEEAKNNVEKRYGSKITDKTTLKIYGDLEQLRQSVKLSFPWQFAGWYEYPESVKMSKYNSKESYVRVLEHELLHKITIRESNNNMPYWFTEGLAVYFTNFYNELNQVKTKNQYVHLYNEEPMGILELEKINLEKLKDNSEISKYYDSAGLIVKSMVDSYGLDKVRKIVKTLGSYPYEIGTGAEVDSVSKHRFRLVIREVFGIDLNQLDKEIIKNMDEI